jgi:hypothetical protein
LNEKYARQEGGIEIVTKHINGYFSKLITLIESKGGDILKVLTTLCCIHFELFISLPAMP